MKDTEILDRPGIDVWRRLYNLITNRLYNNRAELPKARVNYTRKKE
jgi:hypothetical protein